MVSRSQARPLVMTIQTKAQAAQGGHGAEDPVRSFEQFARDFAGVFRSAAVA